VQMKGGTIVLMGGAELRTGAWMQRGTIILLTPLRLLPTFADCCTYGPAFLRLYANHLRPLGFSIPDGGYRRYAGDSAVPGKGEILVWWSRPVGILYAGRVSSPGVRPNSVQHTTSTSLSSPVRFRS